MTLRWFQCPGCWSVAPVQDPDADYYECGCGEKLTCIDLRGDFSATREQEE